ncbi:trace amine-associated receptor 13c-like [Enoplosus armatus]|uniref:trace amine-associated receptor 13c-like n=1 Tax=Enoplosus armatus TaxID=215367 RepID=UPI0039935BE5
MMETLEGTDLCFPQLLNTSCRKTQRSHSETILTYIVLSSISLLTATLNLLVIISISHYKQLHTPTNLLLLSLAVSDFLVGLLMFFQIVLIDGCWFLGDLTCTLYHVFDYIITSASIGTMVLISVDRYVAICDPLHYSTKVTQTRVRICVCLCWMCSALCHSLLLKDNLEQPGRYTSCTGECVVVIDYIAGLADLLLSFIGPVTVIIVLYMRVFVVAVSQARAMRSHITAVTLQCSVKVTAKKSEMKAARTLGVVIAVFLICVCPYFGVALTGQDTLLNASSAAFVICLFYFNSCLNPVIYAFFYPWFRKSIKLIVTLQILKPGSCEANIA